MLLSEVKSGKVIIKKVSLTKPLTERLLGLGIKEGCSVKVLFQNASGCVIYYSCAKIALQLEICKNILVQKC